MGKRERKNASCNRTEDVLFVVVEIVVVVIVGKVGQSEEEDLWKERKKNASK